MNQEMQVNQEMQDLIGALGDNEFTLQEIIYNPEARRGAASARAKFVKHDVVIRDSNENDDSGNTIRVDVQYDVCLDHIHRSSDHAGGITCGDYDAGKARTYINELMRRGRAESRGGMYSRSKARSKARSKTRSKTRSKARS